MHVCMPAIFCLFIPCRCKRWISSECGGIGQPCCSNFRGGLENRNTANPATAVGVYNSGSPCSNGLEVDTQWRDSRGKAYCERRSKNGSERECCEAVLLRCHLGDACQQYHTATAACISNMSINVSVSKPAVQLTCVELAAAYASCKHMAAASWHAIIRLVATIPSYAAACAMAAAAACCSVQGLHEWHLQEQPNWLRQARPAVLHDH
jgi:hypothetical protein